jgi:hypothetical protein
MGGFRLKFIVIRKACLMEDEGRDHIVASYNTRLEADAKVTEYISDGYFSRNDMTIVEVD